MQRIIYSFFLILMSLIIFFIIYLSTIGIETSKFNNTIINEIKKKNPNTQLSLNKIKIKFDIKKIQIYLSTIEPQIIYENIKIPIKEINLYTKIISVLTSKNEIDRAVISLENFKIKEIQKLAIRIKPSNFKTYLLNNLNNGEVRKIFIDVQLGKNLNINDFKINGSIKKVDIKIINNLLIKDVSFNFILDKKLALINSLNAKHLGVSISNGSVSLKKDKQIDIEGKFNSQFNLNEDAINKLFTKSNLKFLEKNKVNAKGSLQHDFSLKIDENFKLIDYDYKINGSILESQIILKNNFKTNFIKNLVKKVLISKTTLTLNLKKTIF